MVWGRVPEIRFQKGFGAVGLPFFGGEGRGVYPFACSDALIIKGTRKPSRPIVAYRFLDLS